MSINRLNLQIGRNSEDNNRPKKDIIIEQIEDCIEEFIEEEDIPRAPVAPAEHFMNAFEQAFGVPVAPPPQREPTRQELMAESMTLYHANTQQSLREVPQVSDADRIQMLEDAFAQMKRGQPNTLVTGIGASLDSGGGAVWLWDLEDISIGAPLNGVYPSITNGAVLKYNSSTNQWYAGTGSSDTAEVTTAQVDLTNPQEEDDLIPNQNDIIGYSALGTLNTQLDWNKKIYDYFTESMPLKGGTICAADVTNTGAEDGILRIQSTGGDTGKLILVDTNGNPSATLNAQLGNAHFNSGVTAGLFVQTNATSTSAFTKVNFSGLVNLNDDTTVASTKELIFNRGNINTTVGGLVVKGITPSSAASANPAISEILNVSYGNTTVGAANALNKADAINYNGKVESVYNIANKQYVDSAVATGAGVAFQFDGTCNVLLPRSDAANADVKENAGYFYINEGAQGAANSEWVGIAGLVIATNQLIIWSATESRWFAGAIENDSAYLLRSAGTSQKITGPLYVNRTTGSAIILQKDGVTNGTLFADGSVNLSKVTSTGQIIGETNIQSTDYIRSGTYLEANSYLTVKTNTNLNQDSSQSSKVTVARSTTNSSAYNNFVIVGNNCQNNAGTAQVNMIKTYIYASGSSNTDFIDYYGSTTGDDRLQTRSSCDARYPRVTQSNNFTGASNTFREIVLQDTTSSSLSNYLLLCKDNSGTQTIEVMAERGHILMKKQGAELEVVRGDTSGGSTSVGGIHLKGCQPGNTDTGKDLLQCTYYDGATDANNKSGDAIQYYGRSDGSNMLMNRDAVSTLIGERFGDGTWTTINSGSSGQSVSTMSGGAWFIKYRTVNNGNTVEVLVHAAKGGPRVTAGDIIGTLPSNLRPANDLPILFTAKNASSTVDQGPGALGVMAAGTATIAVIYCIPDTGDSNASSSGAQDYWANFSYALGS